MAKVFISYRRSDDALDASKIAEYLRQCHYDVFFDTESIDGGEEYERVISQNISDCDVFITLIGVSWNSKAGLARLSEPSDFVRREISFAIRSNRNILPVLVGGAKMPCFSSLPQEISKIGSLQFLDFNKEIGAQEKKQLLENTKTLSKNSNENTKRNDYVQWFNSLVEQQSVNCAQFSASGNETIRTPIQLFGVWKVEMFSLKSRLQFTLHIEERNSFYGYVKSSIFRNYPMFFPKKVKITGQWEVLVDTGRSSFVGMGLLYLQEGVPIPIPLQIPMHRQVGDSITGQFPNTEHAFTSENISPRHDAF